MNRPNWAAFLAMGIVLGLIILTLSGIWYAQ